ncbi:hypothetical protein NC77_16145 [Janthinobacterium lividum]|nr:hypothetical protein NC77_16145 [Janthinobacterium lividum]
MLLARQRLEIGRRVVQAVTVTMVNDQAARHRAVLSLPYQHCPLAPHVRLGRFYPGAIEPGMRFAAHAHGANG